MIEMNIVLFFLMIAAFFYAAYAESRAQLHMAQLEGYRPKQYLNFIILNLKNVFAGRNVFLVLEPVAGILIISLLGREFRFGILLMFFFIWVLAAFYAGSTRQKRLKKAKKPLVFTKRAIRLFALALFVQLISAYIAFLYIAGVYGGNALDILLLFGLDIYLAPFVMLFSATVIYPLEMHIQKRYFRQAQEKIRNMRHVKVVGVTGSYGKTSTKYFITTLLSQKFNTLMTPESYNTPMGITRVIREQLSEKHEVFVCEMGARYRGDIKTLCELAGPSIGVITAIGPQHLETMKTLENIAKTKFELVDSLPKGGIAVLNGDNEYIRRHAQNIGVKTLFYGMDSGRGDLYITCDCIKNSREGLEFKAILRDGTDFVCRTSLLGRHNVQNLLAAICVALEMGLTVDEIQAGLSEIKPVPHRLQIIDAQNGVTVIDDAFNSNPEGARQALEILKEINAGKKIVVTPGMVELGAVEKEENRKMGKLMASCCDYAVLVGKRRTLPIAEGLKEENFPPENIVVVQNLDEATKVLSGLVKSGDIVLFENDLPDNYDE
jgi:UDP-N-acetylmuramoyl-tripeptide--D-alanyl-D-alanine ligase